MEECRNVHTSVTEEEKPTKKVKGVKGEINDLFICQDWGFTVTISSSMSLDDLADGLQLMTSTAFGIMSEHILCIHKQSLWFVESRMF